jgi:hypothetical protein
MLSEEERQAKEARLRQLARAAQASRAEAAGQTADGKASSAAAYAFVDRRVPNEVVDVAPTDDGRIVAVFTAKASIRSRGMGLLFSGVGFLVIGAVGWGWLSHIVPLIVGGVLAVLLCLPGLVMMTSSSLACCLSREGERICLQMGREAPEYFPVAQIRCVEISGSRGAGSYIAGPVVGEAAMLQEGAYIEPVGPVIQIVLKAGGRITLSHGYCQRKSQEHAALIASVLGLPLCGGVA